MIAAPRPTRTPNFPRPARCGLDEFAPSAHTIAEMIRASTARIKPDGHRRADDGLELADAGQAVGVGTDVDVLRQQRDDGWWVDRG